MPHPVLKATEQAAGALQSHMVSAHQREPPFWNLTHVLVIGSLTGNFMSRLESQVRGYALLSRSMGLRRQPF